MQSEWKRDDGEGLREDKKRHLLGAYHSIEGRKGNEGQKSSGSHQQHGPTNFKFMLFQKEVRLESRPWILDHGFEVMKVTYILDYSREEHDNSSTLA